MPQPASTTGDTSWFIQDRFGMFIHWGLYSVVARHEWVKQIRNHTDEEYQRYFDHFDPDLFDPQAWAETARAAGMKYVVITTKHHDGFCLWDSKLTDYKATKTPAGRDLLRPFVEAFRAAGLKIGFYHSLLDWHHPHYLIDGLHPLANNLERARELNQKREMAKYTEYLHGQVRELLTQYGKIDLLWFDFTWFEPEQADPEYPKLRGKSRDDWHSLELIKLVRELQPGIIVNNRLGLPPGYTDFYTPEQYQPDSWYTVDGQPVVWEACQTFSGSWGYFRDEDSWKSPEQLIQMLVNTVSCGGNLLMNVGPTSRGVFDWRAVQALEVYQNWLKFNARSIYGCTQSDFTAPSDCRLTQNGQRLYVHIFAWPFQKLALPGLAGRVEYAQLLHDGSEIQFKNNAEEAVHANIQSDNIANTLYLELPVRKPPMIVPVIELFLK